MSVFEVLNCETTKTWTLVSNSSLDRLFGSNFSLHQYVQSSSNSQWLTDFFPGVKATGFEVTVSPLANALG